MVADADKALEMDPDFVKAYHRRGKANMALGFYESALADFKKCSYQHNDADIRASIAEASQKLKERDGEGAPECSNNVDLDKADGESMP